MEIVQADFARLAGAHPDAAIIEAWETARAARDHYNALRTDL